MATYSRPAKAVSGSGTNAVIDGNKWPASEINADFDGIVTALNSLNEDNFDAGTQIPSDYLETIPQGKVDDHADTAENYALTATPGDSGTPSLPGTFLLENRRLRYRIGANRGYLTNVKYMDASAVAQDATWYEPKIVGRNLLPNPGFELHSAGTPNAPDGWALVSTPATVAIENPAHTSTGLEKRSLNIVTNGANEGISCTVGGLKASTKYLVGVAFSITDNGTVAGVIRLATANGLASGAYQNLQIDNSTESAGTVVIAQGLVKSTSTPDSMTVSITATTAGGDFNIHSVWMHEVSDGYPDELPSIPTRTASLSAATSGMTGWTGTGNAWRTDTISSLSLSAYIPAPGYRLTYEVSVPIRSTNSSDEGLIAYGAIQRNVDGGGASTVQGPAFFEGHAVSSNGTFGHTFVMRYVLDNPTPGSTYAMTFLLGAYDAADYADVIVAPSVNTVQMSANSKLILERL